VARRGSGESEAQLRCLDRAIRSSGLAVTTFRRSDLVDRTKFHQAGFSGPNSNVRISRVWPEIGKPSVKTASSATSIIDCPKYLSLFLSPTSENTSEQSERTNGPSQTNCPSFSLWQEIRDYAATVPKDSSTAVRRTGTECGAGSGTRFGQLRARSFSNAFTGSAGPPAVDVTRPRRRSPRRESDAPGKRMDPHPGDGP
jgi:hypothetical protein